MANARKLMKNQSTIGRASKVGKEAQLVCVVFSIVNGFFSVPCTLR